VKDPLIDTPPPRPAVPDPQVQLSAAASKADKVIVLGVDFLDNLHGCLLLYWLLECQKSLDFVLQCQAQALI